MAISKSLRFKIFHRDGFVCQYCGNRPPDVVLELDHIHPRSAGGCDDEDNLVTACDACNRGKSARQLTNKPPRPDADMKYLSAQQEIAEAERFLYAKQQRDELENRVIEALKKTWNTVFPYWYSPDENEFRNWLLRNTPEEVEYALKATSARADRIGLSHHTVKNYIGGVLRGINKDKQQVGN